MTKNFSLSVSRPCAENWNDFTKVSDGRFCGSCNKVVVDFTTMSDDEIVSYFKDAKDGHTCGRFSPGQLKMYSGKDFAIVKPGPFLIKAGLAAMLLLMSGRHTYAQHAAPVSTIAITQNPYGAPNERSPLPDSRVIEGVVISAEDKSPLPGVNVILKGSRDGTVTDVNGKFRFPIPLNDGDVLIFTFIGLRTSEIKITKEHEPYTVLIAAMKMEIMGEVSYNSVYEEKPSAIRRVWNRVKRLF